MLRYKDECCPSFGKQLTARARKLFCFDYFLPSNLCCSSGGYLSTKHKRCDENQVCFVFASSKTDRYRSSQSKLHTDFTLNCLKDICCRLTDKQSTARFGLFCFDLSLLHQPSPQLKFYSQEERKRAGHSLFKRQAPANTNVQAKRLQTTKQNDVRKIKHQIRGPGEANRSKQSRTDKGRTREYDFNVVTRSCFCFYFYFSHSPFLYIMQIFCHLDATTQPNRSHKQYEQQTEARGNVTNQKREEERTRKKTKQEKRPKTQVGALSNECVEVPNQCFLLRALGFLKRDDMEATNQAIPRHNIASTLSLIHI